MSEVQKGVHSALFGSCGSTSVSRGLGEFRALRPIFLIAPEEALLALPVDGLNEQRLREFVSLCKPQMPQLIITKRRALALGLSVSTPMALPLSASDGAETILALVTNSTHDYAPVGKPASGIAAAAIQLAKLSQNMPAVLAANVSSTLPEHIIGVQSDAVARFAEYATRSLLIESDAAVPLSSGLSTRFVVFRDALGGGQTAIIVGEPDSTKPVPVRLHSACLTGDVFGSRRCDCGDQLRLALRAIHDRGGGIVLYLAQEGRGLGLANKMRTYQLQDEGLDTFEANTTLGFDDDERDYGVAAAMLQMLDCTRIVLLTNNLSKLDGLTKSGIEIVDRLSLNAPINAYNHRYMSAKAARAEFRLDHLVKSSID